MYLKRGALISTRKQDVKFLLPRNFRAMEWFRPPGGDFANSYGDLLGVYKLTRKLNLLNLGSAKVREDLVNKKIGLTKDDIDPDQQYCGHAANEKVHKAILKSDFFKRFDGTIISDATNDPCFNGDLDGPEEIVLFTKRARGALVLVNKP